MKTTRSDKWICLLFTLFLGGMLLLFLLLPKERFSAREKRYLADAPDTALSAVLSGQFGAEAEDYAADHLPGRDFFVGLNAVYDRISGRQITKEIVLGKSGRLYESPAALDRRVIARNMDTVNAFAAAAERPVVLMLVPSAGCLLPADMPLLSDPYEDAAILAEVDAQAAEPLETLSLLPVFEAEADPGALFYRTDHHWTASGARLGAATFLRSRGREVLPVEAYTITEAPDFRGTCWSRAAFWTLPGETLELWDSGGSFTVENREQDGAHEGLFYPEHLAEEDKYPVYLDGNHSLVRITNRDPAAQGKLLVVRDSFANCLGCFLADAYAEVTLVDLRYYRGAVSDLLAEGCDEVLIVYGVRNFMTDGNLIRLE